MDLMHRLAPPSAEHLLGTDEGGRDVLTRLLYGSRVSLMVGIVPTLLSMMIGAILGVAFSQDGHFAHDIAAGLFHQGFQSPQGFTGGDDVIHN